jgi:hypothetical protein
MRGKINAFSILVGKTEGKRQSGRNISRWEDITKMDPKEMEWSCICSSG